MPIDITFSDEVKNMLQDYANFRKSDAFTPEKALKDYSQLFFKLADTLIPILNIREFEKELRIFNLKNLSTETIKDIIYTIEKTLRDEDPTIQNISAYFLLIDPNQSTMLYFVISSAGQSVDRHMRLKLLGNPDWTAHYLDETEQMTQEQLDEHKLVEYEFPTQY